MLVGKLTERTLLDVLVDIGHILSYEPSKRLIIRRTAPELLQTYTDALSDLHPSPGGQ